MAIYEYVCEACQTKTERRMSMNDALAHIECPSCGKTAKKAFSMFAVAGVAEAGFGDGPAPWDDDGDFGEEGGHSHDFADDFDEGIDF